MSRIIIPVVLSCGLAIWTGYAGLKAIAKVSRKYQAVCYIAPAVVIVGLIKLSLLFL